MQCSLTLIVRLPWNLSVHVHQKWLPPRDHLFVERTCLILLKCLITWIKFLLKFYEFYSMILTLLILVEWNVFVFFLAQFHRLKIINTLLLNSVFIIFRIPKYWKALLMSFKMFNHVRLFKHVIIRYVYVTNDIVSKSFYCKNLFSHLNTYL